MKQVKRDAKFHVLLVAFIFSIILQSGCNAVSRSKSPRELVSINFDWRFTKDDPQGDFSDSLKYPVPPAPARGNRGFGGARRGGVAATPTPAPEPAPEVDVTSGIAAFMLPTSNNFIVDPAKRYTRPSGNYGGDIPYVNPSFDDSGWTKVNLPHDYAIEGPFITTGGAADFVSSWRRT